MNEGLPIPRTSLSAIFTWKDVVDVSLNGASTNPTITVTLKDGRKLQWEGIFAPVADNVLKRMEEEHYALISFKEIK